MKRTQIYLQERQKEQLEQLAHLKGKSLAEVIREAVELYLVENKKQSTELIADSSGIWKNRDDIDSCKYVEGLRNDLNTRLEDNLK